jgi:hypothetical protein
MNAIPWYKSNTLRGLLVAVLAFLLQHLGLGDQFADAGVYVDYFLTGVEGLALAYSAWARSRQPTPPVTLTKAAAEAHVPKASLLASFLTLLIVVSTLTPMLTGCNTLAVSRAETLEQKAAALLGDFNIYQQASLKVGSDETVSPEFRRVVLDAAITAKPIADRADEALRQYRGIRRQLAEGSTTNEKVAIAAANLQGWIQQLAPTVKTLRNVVEGAHP